MNCAKHNEVAAEAYCRTCGKALCANCVRDVQGAVFCEECLADRVRQASTPRPAAPQAYVPGTPDAGSNPGLAAMLGFIPGVGAMYNGQFLKGFIHVVAFVCLIWATDNISGLFGILIGTWVFYMVFDAYTTAKARRYGQPLPDPLGFNRMFGGPDPFLDPRVTGAGERIGEGVSSVGQRFVSPQDAAAGYDPSSVPPDPAPENLPRKSPIGAFILIGLGVLFLLDNMNLFSFRWVHSFWPLILIGLGIWIFMRRVNAVQR
jgi:hypothetical protein